MEILEGITRRYDACQRLSRGLVCFRLSLSSENNIVSGDKVRIDTTFFDGDTALHIADTATRFSAATFLNKRNATFGQSVEEIWLAFVLTWSLAYSGYPNKLRTDPGSVFTSDRWKQLIDLKGTQLRLSGVEAHSFLGIDRRYQNPLRLVYRKHDTLILRFHHSIF